MADNMTDSGNTTDAPAPEIRRRRLLRVVTTWMAMRAKHRSEERLLRLALEEQEAFTRACEDAMCANSFTTAYTAIELLHPIQRERWTFQRYERWFEDTLPHLGDAHFRQFLRVAPTTFSCLVKVLTPVLERAHTKHAAGCFSGEANSHRSVPATFNGHWLRLICRAEMGEHIRKFYRVSGFPQAISALDGCHIRVSPPEEHAIDYFNYKGW
ncbi:hypothetical protein HPB52_018781 [Rhipicephalus sanguineus]|uniref:DDE Tnp4 domain-containing protein n=1 Tax=Rhipicephalus sanguineus TaxID=34632 RepID=A0A9D4PYB2_RHISA|nr:hypothetical protein HPB52_018781 [Rhipicephalus sanguineus]